jgi:hypothetical protein
MGNQMRMKIYFRLRTGATMKMKISATQVLVLKLSNHVVVLNSQRAFSYF